jgi:tetratricopeptide (TPR) repeat protein
MGRRERMVVGVFVCFLAWAALQPLDGWVARYRLMFGYNRPTPITKMVEFRPTAITGVLAGAMLGSFRGVAANFMWLKMQRLWDEGKAADIAKYDDAQDVMRTVTLLDPHWLEPWVFTGWHYAYNLSYEAEAAAQKAQLETEARYYYELQGRLIEMGVNYLKEGISYNPAVYDLYFELGWTYFDKLKDYEEATKWTQAALDFEHPEYLCREIAHAYERIPDIPRALDWYEYAMKQNPADNTARGAILTIRERYLPSWRFMEQGQYKQALAALQPYMLVDPVDRIGLHQQALIYETMGNDSKALETWTFAATKLSINWYAERQVARLCAKLGRPVPLDVVFLPHAEAGGALARPTATMRRQRPALQR